MISRILYLFGYLIIAWAFFVSALWMDLPPERPFTIVAGTILFIKLIFIGTAGLYSVLGFRTLLSR